MTNEVITLTGLSNEGKIISEISPDALILISQGGVSVVAKWSTLLSAVSSNIPAVSTSSNSVQVDVTGSATKNLTNAVIDLFTIKTIVPGNVKIGTTVGGGEILNKDTTTAGQTISFRKVFISEGTQIIYFTAENAIFKLYLR